MIRSNVFAGKHVLTIDLMRQPIGEYAARISRVMEASGGFNEGSRSAD